MPAASSANRRGLVLGEVVVVLALLGVLAMLLVVTMGDSRRNGRLGQCQANLRFFAMMTPTYAADNSDLVWGLSWKKGVSYPGFEPATTDRQAQVNQVLDVLRRRGGTVGTTVTPPAETWLPHALYSSLVLADYRAPGSEQSAPMIESVCPSDENRFKWNRDPVGYMNAQYVPNPEGRSSGTLAPRNRRWAFSSTYAYPIAFFDLSTTVGTRVRIGTHASYFVSSSAVLGQPSLASVRHPSAKVMLHDSHAFHAGTRKAFVDYPEARVSLLMADGSGSTRVTSDANLGWNPNLPADGSPQKIIYDIPASPATHWYPRPLNGELDDWVTLHYTSTRDGIYGRDFDGPPAETGQP